MKKKPLIIAFAILLAGSGTLIAGTKVIDYGFEDWTGDAATTPGYVFTAYDANLWNDQTSGSEVISNCSGKVAFSGTYYIHRNWYTGEVDPCLGSQPHSINAQMYIGANYAYPNQGYGDDTYLPTAVTSDTLTMRFWFRTTGDWKHQMTTGDEHIGDLKFFRMYAVGSGGDGGTAYVHVIAEDNTDTAFHIYQSVGSTWSDYWGPTFYAGSDLQDEDWHSFCVSVRTNHPGGTPGNVTTSVWFDDWDISGTPDGQRTITVPDFDSQWERITLGQNWSAAQPVDSLGIDYDGIEVWDGLPDSASDTGPDSDPDPEGDSGSGGSACFISMSAP